jgi:hypothetical protein
MGQNNHRRELSVAQMVRFLMVEPTHEGSSPEFSTSDRIFLDLFGPFGDVRLVGEGVSIDYECVCDYIVNLKMLCRLSILKVLMGVGCACVRSQS